MPDCEHFNRRLDSFTEADQRGRRTLHFVCKDCEATVDVLSMRTDEELAAAMEAQQ